MVDPLNMTREQIARRGPVRSTPNMEEMQKRAAETKTAVTERLAAARELAIVSESPAFRALVESAFQGAMQAMLLAKGDDERRNAQATAKAWTEIRRELLSAAEQVPKLEETLSRIS